MPQTTTAPTAYTINPSDFQKEGSVSNYVKITALYERLGLCPPTQRIAVLDGQAFKTVLKF